MATKDAKFRDLAATAGPPPQVIWLRVGNGPTRAVEALPRSSIPAIRASLADPGAPLLELPEPPAGP